MPQEASSFGRLIQEKEQTSACHVDGEHRDKNEAIIEAVRSLLWDTAQIFTHTLAQAWHVQLQTHHVHVERWREHFHSVLVLSVHSHGKQVCVSLTHAPALVCVCNVWGKETKPVCLELLFFPVCTFSLLLSSCCFLLPSFSPNPALWLRVVNRTQGHSQLFSVSAHKSGRKDSDVWMEVAACLDLSTVGDWKCTALPTAHKTLGL